MTYTTHYLQESMFISRTEISTIFSPFLITPSLLSLFSPSHLESYFIMEENVAFTLSLQLPLYQRKFRGQ